MLFEGRDAREKLLVLLTMCFALFMVMLDNTVVNVALPTLSRELAAGVSDLQWIVDGYALPFASLLLVGGILGDRYGRRRLFLVGLALFSLSSLACGLAASSGELIAARALQGVGAAILMPGTLSILTVTFPAEERARAIGIWAGVSALALALGPTVGGWLVEHVGWESVFFLNVPIGLIASLVVVKVVQESRSEQTRELDVPGLAFGTGGLFSITYALIEANDRGWMDPLIVVGFALGGVLLAAFLSWEGRSANAMMPLGFFRIPAFSAGNAVAFAVSLGMFGAFFFLSLYMQLIRGYTAFDAGVRFLPMTGMIVLTAPNAGRLAQKYGSRLPMTVGLTLGAVGFFLLSRIAEATPYWMIAPLLVMIGVGVALNMAPMTAAVMNAVGAERSGLGSAMTNTSRQVGGVFGIALLGTILTTKLESSLMAALAAMGLSSSHAARIAASASDGRFDPALASRLAGTNARAVEEAFSRSFLDGFDLALLVASGALLAAAIIANRWIPSRKRDESAPVGDSRRQASRSVVESG